MTTTHPETRRWARPLTQAEVDAIVTVVQSRSRHVLQGQIDVALPPPVAFRLFTARGEQLWVPGWSPAFLVDVEDDISPGTTFRTVADGRETTWIVVGSDPPRMVTYARFTPGHSATTVRVELEATDAGSVVTVGYDVTALEEGADAVIDRFAQDFPEMLREWEQLISVVTPGLAGEA